VTKSSEAEQARRVNVTVSLLKKKTSLSKVLARLIAHYGLSRRQAYRYLQQAQKITAPLPVPETKAVFTVKLARGLIAEVRRQARRQNCSISDWVDRSLRQSLNQFKGHG
jgi:predicted HicB family RNase H-like nuclease